ncbi:proline-rich protein PRCC [Harpegnathos saltator]|uniref:proline-rich protein PRCC n=1 Tax=Harpegnathos saltator TaxID=610380 RepID=UPI000DBEE2D6|nr:proline-rich protein PRCC [Harpegnathos saltator]XP_025155189.1 proline-rich protein PRCC [Harpegnathos saltator]
MSLVAYDSSDEGSENEENESMETIIANNNNDGMKNITVQANSRLSLPAPKVVSSTNDEEEKEENTLEENFRNFLDMLPKPKDSNSAGNIEENDDILLKKEVENKVIKSAKKQTVKITVPSLLEFKDIEEESMKPKNQTIQSSVKGCGLFSILVPPKAEATRNNNTLIPQVIKNTLMKPSIHQAKIQKQSDTRYQINNSKAEKIVMNKVCTETNSDDEDEAVDFFGLTSSKDVPDDSMMVSSDSELYSSDFTGKLNDEKTKLTKHVQNDTSCNSPYTGSIISTNSQLNSSNKTLISNVMNLSKEEILLKNKAEVGPKLPIPEQEYNIDTQGNIAFDEKAIEYLCGRRGVKRKDREIDEANIIEINGEDIKPDEREWLVKALTEESVQRPVSMQNCGINSQSKKKHQITYLAHQAKAMELELKNQWSQNRMARKQTKSKYGF